MILRRFWFLSLVLLLDTFPSGVLADQILKTSGFSTCLSNSPITVQKVDIEYNNDNKTVSFNVAGTSTQTMNVTAQLNVTAYGTQVYHNEFNPCDESTFVAQLCPVPEGSFSATGTQVIPSSFATLIPSIAFSVPDIAAQATLQLKAPDTGNDIACITSDVNNGKTVDLPAVSYVAVGIAGAALVATSFSALSAAVASGGTGGTGTLSPSFSETVGWFQGMAMNGMMSVNYPPVYRSFAKNFAFSTGLVPWTAVQTSIDNFRAKTGGNLTDDSVQFLQNATLTFSDGSGSSVVSRALSKLLYRDITTDVNSSATAGSSSSGSSLQTTVSGIEAYAEQLTVPQANTFMTVLLVVAIVIAAIIVGILLFKLILEMWALFGSFPEGLKGFRTHYWGTMARTIVSLILIFYGIWVLYCIFQFTHGDSWAAKILAGVTLALFTGILAFFVFKIWHTARQLKKAEGDVSGLYEDKETWLKYSIFYDSYRKDYWWIFIPAIIYMFAKGCVLAAADGHGLTQTVAQLVIECLMFGLLIWSRPYERRSGNIINIFIQVVRVLSVVCILVFVEELGIAQTTKTITGVILIAVQSALTGLLAILIAVNAIISCCRQNPHRRRRKEAEKLNRDIDALTPLDAHNSLLSHPTLASGQTYNIESKQPLAHDSVDSFAKDPANPYSGAMHLRPYAQQSQGLGLAASRERLVDNASPLEGSPPETRHLMGYEEGYRGVW
ncbi:hypothetical protein OIDMADRAFT_178248 [Oidiodendron maius Zn]|uniref:ML-like domain-containing protein n=1 Tax=Oidiodendron maius (strain Zn) TaxID=913774 RepID=A0A0C3DQ75_OIDMZ|nr:hypothetical protein OIDMADRAFT_178248 [Oidiodendron maius Zn]